MLVLRFTKKDFFMISFTFSSEFFANILMENYDLTNYKGDPLYEQKLKEYKEYVSE